MSTQPVSIEVVVRPEPLADYERAKWAERLKGSVQEMIAEIENVDFATVFSDAIKGWQEKMLPAQPTPSLLKAYVKMAARLATADPVKAKENYKLAVQDARFASAVDAAAGKFADIMSYVKGAAKAGADGARRLADYIEPPEVRPFMIPPTVAALTVGGYFALIVWNALKEGRLTDAEAQAALSDITAQIKAVLDKVLGTQTTVSINLNMQAVTPEAIISINFTPPAGGVTVA